MDDQLYDHVYCSFKLISFAYLSHVIFLCTHSSIYSWIIFYTFKFINLCQPNLILNNNYYAPLKVFNYQFIQF